MDKKYWKEWQNKGLKSTISLFSGRIQRESVGLCIEEKMELYKKSESDRKEFYNL